MTSNEELIAEAQVWDKQYRDQMIAIAPYSMVGVMLRLADALATAQTDLAARDAVIAAAKTLWEAHHSWDGGTLGDRMHRVLTQPLADDGRILLRKPDGTYKTNDEVRAEAQKRFPLNHTVPDPEGETGEAQSDPYGYEEYAHKAFIAGAEWVVKP